VTRSPETIVETYGWLREQASQVLVGQDTVFELLFIALLTEGHVLLEGVPGTGKTLMAKTLARLVDVDFRRLQFTADMMPSDVVGTTVLAVQRGRFFLKRGPIFSPVILADEITRAPAKTQSALLEAMEEGRATIDGVPLQLPQPFFVCATQNPIEQEGTYPLPEAQLDRFMFKILVDYPSYEEELTIAESTTAGDLPTIQAVLDREGILAIQKIVRKVLIARSVTAYAVQLVRATRPHSQEAPEFVKKYLTWGAGPRASQFLVLAAKARAVLHGRYYVSCEDIRAVAAPVLRHRIITNFNAEAEGIKPDDLVRRLTDVIPRDPQEKSAGV